MTPHPGTALPLLYGLASAVLFGAAAPASKPLLEGIQPQVLAGLLYLGAALGVAPAAIREKSFRAPWRTGRRNARLLAGAVLLGGVAGPLLLLLGLRLATAGSVSLWLNLEFVATVVLGHFLFREPLSFRGWIAAAGTLAAAALLAGGEGAAGAASASLVAAACLCWGFDNHFTALIDGITPAQTTLWKGLAAGAVNLAVGGALAGRIGSPGSVAAALAVGAVSYGLSVVLYIRSAQGLGASRSQMVFSTAPFFGVLASVLFLGESFTGFQAASAAVILASLAVLFSERHSHRHRHDTQAHRHDHGHSDGHHDHDPDGPDGPGRHSHWHQHDPTEHEHGHWPDLHHRHDHAGEKKEE